MSSIYGKGHTGRIATGHAPAAHSAHPRNRSESRVCRGPPHSADLQVRLARRTGLALSRVAPHGARRPDRILLGHDREQSQSQVLPADTAGKPAAGQRNRTMERDRRRDCRDPPGGLMTRKGPAWLTRWVIRARATLSARQDRELRDELQLHLHLLTEEFTAQGMPPDLARQRAHREFGNAALFQEASHDLFSFRVVEDLFQDLRYAIREMRRSAGFTCISVLSLAFGIGVATATFVVIDAFMLRGLPGCEPEKRGGVFVSQHATSGA